MPPFLHGPHGKDEYVFPEFVFRCFPGICVTFLHLLLLLFALASAGSALQALGAAERAGDEAPKPFSVPSLCHCLALSVTLALVLRPPALSAAPSACKALPAEAKAKAESKSRSKSKSKSKKTKEEAQAKSKSKSRSSRGKTRKQFPEKITKKTEKYRFHTETLEGFAATF